MLTPSKEHSRGSTSSSVKIYVKSVKGFLSYDRRYKQWNRDFYIIYLHKEFKRTFKRKIPFNLFWDSEWAHQDEHFAICQHFSFCEFFCNSHICKVMFYWHFSALYIETYFQMFWNIPLFRCKIFWGKKWCSKEKMGNGDFSGKYKPWLDFENFLPKKWLNHH